MSRSGAAAIVLDRAGRNNGRAWRYRLTWQDSFTGVILVREWGVAGSERTRRCVRAFRTREACQIAIDRTVIRLRRLGYR